MLTWLVLLFFPTDILILANTLRWSLRISLKIYPNYRKKGVSRSIDFT